MLKSEKLMLSPGDVALMLRKSTRTVNRWGEMGLLGEVTMTAGGQRRYHRDVVEALVRAQAAELQAEVDRFESSAAS